MGLKKGWVSALAGIMVLLAISCDDELETIGEGVIPGEPFNSDVADYDVFATNKKVVAVQTNKLPLYQAGVYNDPIFGKRQSIITTQISFSGLQGNPRFGNYSQSLEDLPAASRKPDTIPENETVKRVTMFLPFQLTPNENADQDNDGVPDELEAPSDRDNPDSDWDSDGLNDSDERKLGTDPFNFDTDGDGISDGADSEPRGDNKPFPRAFGLDSIFSGRFTDYNQMNQYLGEQFRVKVERSSFFLRNLDPNDNFESQQEYFSNRGITNFVEGDPLFEGVVTVSNREVLMTGDNPDTTEEESDFVLERRNPGIFIELDKDFFNENILDKEGSSELLNQSNFNNFIRGLHISITPESEDLMLMLDLADPTAGITITYEFDDFKKADDEGNSDRIEQVEREFTLRFLQNNNNAILGNAVNTFVDEPYDANVAAALDNGENAERLYLKGGAGTYVDINLFGEDGGEEIIDQIKSNNWVINEANLEFYVDRGTLDNAGGTMEPPRLYLLNAEDNTPIYNLATELNLSTGLSLRQILNYDGILQRDDDGKGIKYRLRITDHINDIIVRDAKNVPLRLVLTSNILLAGVQGSMTGDTERVDIPVMNTINPLGTVLYGNNVAQEDEGKKLKLQIFYTQAN